MRARVSYLHAECVTFRSAVCYTCKGGERLEKKLLEKLYEQYYRELYVYVYSLCRQKSLTEDVLQETFVKAFTSLKDSHTNMRAWLYVVARNVCLNTMRKNKRMVLHETPEKRSDGENSEILDGILADERRRILMEGLEHLEERKREILMLQYFGGFSQKEIGAMLQLKPENVRVLAYRAKKELRSYMEVKGYGIS